MAYDNVKRAFHCNDILVLGAGEYDHQISLGVFRVIRDFDMADEIDRLGVDAEGVLLTPGLEPCSPYHEERGARALVEHLLANRTIEPIDHHEVSLGAYGKIDKTLFCRHLSSVSEQLFDKPLVTGWMDGAAGWGIMRKMCNDCEVLIDGTERPATETDYLCVFPHMRDPVTGHHYTQEAFDLAMGTGVTK